MVSGAARLHTTGICLIAELTPSYLPFSPLALWALGKWWIPLFWRLFIMLEHCEYLQSCRIMWPHLGGTFSKTQISHHTKPGLLLRVLHTSFCPLEHLREPSLNLKWYFILFCHQHLTLFASGVMLSLSNWKQNSNLIILFAMLLSMVFEVVLKII